MAELNRQWLKDFLFGNEAEKEAIKQAQDSLYSAKIEKKRLLGELNKAATEEERMRLRNNIDAQNKIIEESNSTINQRKGIVPNTIDTLGRTATATGRGMSQAFAQGISDWAANQSAKGTTAPDRASAHLRQQASMHDIQSGDLQKAQQQSQQIADRDYRVEAEKNAAAGAATENAQRVQNLSASAGAGAAALNRQVKSADYNTMMNRADTQRDKAVERGKEAWDVRQQAERERAAADKADYAAREAETDNRRAASLSYGTGANYEDAGYHINTNTNNGNEKKQEEPNAPEKPAPENTIPEKSAPEKLRPEVSVKDNSTDSNVLITTGQTAVNENGNIDNSKVDFSMTNKTTPLSEENGIIKNVQEITQPVTTDIAGIKNVTYDKKTGNILDDNILGTVDNFVKANYPGAETFTQYFKKQPSPYVTKQMLENYVATLPMSESSEPQLNVVKGKPLTNSTAPEFSISAVNQKY